ncbi:MAG: hypothetical protein ABIH18_06870 [Candidatus Omnitrophota bacterium]
MDKELFKNDIITDFYYAKNPWGLNIFYFITSFFCSPIPITKVLPFILCALSVFYIFRLCFFSTGLYSAIIASILFIFTSWSRKIFSVFGTGDGADFGILFFIMFLYFFTNRKFFKSSFTLILLSLFYPPLFLICFFVYLFYFLIETVKNKKGEIKHILLLLFITSIISIILLKNYSLKDISLISLESMKNMQEFYEGGRTPVLFPSFLKQITNYQSGLAMDSSLSFLLGLSIFIIIILRKKLIKLPKEYWYFITISLFFFIISNIFMYKFYGPSRFMRYSLPLFLILFISTHIAAIIRKNTASLKAQLIILCISISLIGLYFIPCLQKYYIIANQPELYNYLQTLPKNILIAGHPSLMDNIPTFAKRKVLINEETSEPYYNNYYPIIKKRTYDFFKAYYSCSPKEIYNFCKRYNITHIIVYTPHFNGDYLKTGNFYINPFNEYINSLIPSNPKFALIRIPKSEKVFEKKDIFIVKITDNIFWQKHYL